MESKSGLLLNEKDIKLHRKWFKEMCKLIGINVVYKAPLRDKTYTDYTELVSNYQDGEVVGCIFEEHPSQVTTKKLGWVAELQEGASIIHVPYDLHDIQQGALFIIPTGIDCAEGRVFRVVKMSTIMLYPASIACQIVPEYKNTFDSSQLQFKHTSFNLLKEEDI